MSVALDGCGKGTSSVAETCDAGLPSLLRALGSRARRGGGGGGGTLEDDELLLIGTLYEDARRFCDNALERAPAGVGERDSLCSGAPGSRDSPPFSYAFAGGMGGMLKRLRSAAPGVGDLAEGPGLGGLDLSRLSESSGDRTSRPPLGFDWEKLPRPIWLCRRLMGGVGGRFRCDRCEPLRWTGLAGGSESGTGACGDSTVEVVGEK